MQCIKYRAFGDDSSMRMAYLNSILLVYSGRQRVEFLQLYSGYGSRDNYRHFINHDRIIVTHNILTTLRGHFTESRELSGLGANAMGRQLTAP